MRAVSHLPPDPHAEGLALKKGLPPFAMPDAQKMNALYYLTLGGEIDWEELMQAGYLNEADSLSENDYVLIKKYLQQVDDIVAGYVAKRGDAILRSTVEKRMAIGWIQKRYAWMNDENAHRTLNYCLYGLWNEKQKARRPKRTDAGDQPG